MRAQVSELYRRVGAESLGSKMVSVLLDGLPYLVFSCVDVFLGVELTSKKFDVFVVGLRSRHFFRHHPV